MADPTAALAEGSILGELRAATAGLHAQLEARVDVERTFVSRDAYRALITSLHGLHCPLEPRLRAALQTGVPELARLPERAALLAVDLVALGSDPAQAPVMDTLPDLTTPPAAAGVAYVVEGSALGGAVLARLARTRLGITAETGAAFFTPRPGLAGRWRSTTAALEAVGQREGAAGIIAGAMGALVLIDQWFAR